MNSVSIPVMAKCRIGHFVEAQVLQQVGVDCIDESEVLTVADEGNHVNKGKFKARSHPGHWMVDFAFLEKSISMVCKSSGVW